ncbi:feS-binding protein [Geoanaerobacter pelophilus]|uniref:FeS-binding protein n=1 Tax=Geoanaerobacter pelophilus TaxID=60036 RepID=A0ABQ0MIV2_9BACT|nr:(Fe-S)-binding protein [Geoanaerobacter pelophilus]GAW67008.1 feS-binding protein [Geoanaerobacter pelophilus]
MKQSAAPVRSPLHKLCQTNIKGCTNCGKCVRECAFLRNYGTPKKIAAEFDPTDSEKLHRAFECNLCGLCSAVCPEKLEVDAMFLEMRREAVDRDLGAYSEHRPLLNYEKVGTSRRFSLYRLPEGCRTIFFPGCSLPGTRPDAVHNLLALMHQADPTVGVVFDCCLKPSHSLGREQYVNSMFEEMNDWLLRHGVREVLVACPNCQVMFERLGHGMRVRTVWEALAEAGLEPERVSGTVTVHDPCVIRNAEPVHRAVRTLLERQGLVVEEMKHAGKKTVCCGKGGGVNLLNPSLAGEWGELRKKEADGRRVITYCAGCVQALEQHTPTNHLVDLLFAPAQTLAGKKKGAKAPITYLNRLRLKMSFKKKKGNAVLRERSFVAQQALQKRRRWKIPFTQILCGIAAAAAGMHWLSL